jgi:hypothetical protein
VRSLIFTAVLGAVIWSSPAAAASMNAEVFYQRAHALMGKGPMALFSRDYKKLRAEGGAAGEAARTERLTAIKAGKPPRYCPPTDVRGMGSMEFLGRLGKIPVSERRRIDMKEATNRILAGKYPCKT